MIISFKLQVASFTYPQPETCNKLKIMYATKTNSTQNLLAADHLVYELEQKLNN